MRRLFIVGTKLLGLIGFWWAVFTSLQTLSHASVIVSDLIDLAKWILLFNIGVTLFLIFTMLLASILLFRTEWIADKVGLVEDSELPGWPEERKILYLGIVFIGVVALASGIPEIISALLRSYISYSGYKSEGQPLRFLSYNIVPVLKGIAKIVVGFFFVATPDKIILLIDRLQQKMKKK